jgi:hypothetical protein
VLTPRPKEGWGALEAGLGKHLPVLPASPEGLLRLGRWLEEAPAPSLEAKGAGALPVPQETGPAAAPEPPLLRGSTTPWLDRTPPAPARVSELLEQLRVFLGREGFFWLAACAVFPELHWTITAYLGQRLPGADGAPLLTHCPLPRLARLPWLRHGFMPDWLRLSLIQALEPAREAAVRECLVALLEAALAGGEVGAAELRVATAHGQPLRRLLPPLLEHLRRRASPGSPLRDQLFLRFLQNRPLLAAEAPESLRRLLRERPGQGSSVWRHGKVKDPDMEVASRELIRSSPSTLQVAREKFQQTVHPFIFLGVAVFSGVIWIFIVQNWIFLNIFPGLLIGPGTILELLMQGISKAFSLLWVTCISGVLTWVYFFHAARPKTPVEVVKLRSTWWLAAMTLVSLGWLYLWFFTVIILKVINKRPVGFENINFLYVPMPGWILLMIVVLIDVALLFWLPTLFATPRPYRFIVPGSLILRFHR